MKVHRFITNEPFRTGSFELHDRELVHQITTVLKLRADEEIVLCDGKGNEARATITAVEPKKRVVLTVGSMSKNRNEPARKVTLYVALLKRENFELVLQKATELGVAGIVPLQTARTVKLDFKRDRAEKIIREAVEQSGRGTIPTLHETMSVTDALKDAARHDTSLFFDVDATTSPQSLASRASTVGVFVGPEGGWSEEEVEEARHHAIHPATLGLLTLRGETAAIVATYAVISA